MDGLFVVYTRFLTVYKLKPAVREKNRKDVSLLFNFGCLNKQQK
jgi:hypothetical protein